MRVDELRNYARLNPVQIDRIQAKDIALEEGLLTLGKLEFELEDSSTLASLAKYYRIPTTFLGRIPWDLAERNFLYFIESNPDEWLAIEHDGTEASAIYDGSAKLFTRDDFVSVVEAVFDDEDEVTQVQFHQGAVRIDVTTEQLEVAPREGDATRGGVRIQGHMAMSAKKPEVYAFLERLVCHNGATIEETVGKVVTQGRTMEEILQELELACIRVLRHVPARLETWEKMAQQDVADPSQMVHRLLSESAIPAQLESRIIDRIPEIEGDTLYDVVNLITGSWDLSGVEDRHIDLLQAAGGHAIATASQHRCPSCLASLGG